MNAIRKEELTQTIKPQIEFRSVVQNVYMYILKPGTTSEHVGSCRLHRHLHPRLCIPLVIGLDLQYYNHHQCVYLDVKCCRFTAVNAIQFFISLNRFTNNDATKDQTGILLGDKYEWLLCDEIHNDPWCRLNPMILHQIERIINALLPVMLVYTLQMLDGMTGHAAAKIAYEPQAYMNTAG